MSSRVGDEDGFIDTQGLELEQTTDGLIYSQVLSVTPADIDHNMFFHQLTNDTVDKTFSLTNPAFDVVMMATQPELAGLFNLAVPINARLPEKVWEIRITDQSNRTTVLEGTAVLKTIKILDTGLGSVELSLRLEFLNREEIGVLTF